MRPPAGSRSEARSVTSCLEEIQLTTARSQHRCERDSKETAARSPARLHARWNQFKHTRQRHLALVATPHAPPRSQLTVASQHAELKRENKSTSAARAVWPPKLTTARQKRLDCATVCAPPRGARRQMAARASSSVIVRSPPPSRRGAGGENRAH